MVNVQPGFQRQHPCTPGSRSLITLGLAALPALAALTMEWGGWASCSVAATSNASIVETLRFDWVAAAA
jgi:hypothetical protein